MSKLWKYIFIGAGPSTLAALASLPESERRRSLVLESGEGERRKICPDIKASTCSSCFGDACHVLNGVGGASATFGNKLCHFPASEGIQGLMGHLPKANEISGLPFGIDEIESLREKNKVVPFPHVDGRKIYRSDVVLLAEYRRLISDLVSYVQPSAKILTGMKVVGIVPFGSGEYRVQTKSGDEFSASNVVLAVGRSGHADLRDWLSALEIDFEENKPDVGVRIELDSDIIAPEFFYQNDPKYKFDIAGIGNARTFCACKGGKIVPVKFGDAFFADGAFMRKEGDKTNIAFMTRSLESISPAALEDWCLKANRKSNGNLLLGEFPIAGRSPEDIVAKILSIVPEGPTRNHAFLMEKLLRNVVGGAYVELLSREAPNNSMLKIFGPALDLYWPRPSVNEGFATSLKGVTIIGDAVGVSRGVYQALAAGVAWAGYKMNSELIGDTQGDEFVEHKRI